MGGNRDPKSFNEEFNLLFTGGKHRPMHCTDTVLLCLESSFVLDPPLLAAGLQPASGPKVFGAMGDFCMEGMGSTQTLSWDLSDYT